MGEILLTVEASDGLSVIVRDTGVGIAAERLPATLERFTPLDPACPDPGGMVGIDLRLVTRLMERHGGRLTIECKLRVGTTVRATFPNDRIVSRLFLNVDQVDS
jgi:two-component system, OmpR family, phosphate regulon sensor histidine kinase PhoR